MADKRISQLVERINIANNDVLPIVASGATTTNKVTVSTLQDWMQDNLDVGVTSVGLSMPSAFTVTNSPVTTSGNISVVGAGTVSQYIRGDGSLADFPQGGGGGGASVNYYLNGSVSQGTIGGIAYREINKTPILGTGTDFVAIADGYLASFITDAGDPGLLEIPGGNWNFETYFSASSGGGTPSFYVELYKVNSGGTATLIASNSGTPELIAFGTTITPYFSTLAVPTTSLTITDRLALRYYVTPAGRTITMHTENSHLCQIITTFSTGLTALNGLTAQVQNFATGTSGTDFAISSATNIHTFNIPTASATNRGLLSSADWTTFNNKAPSVAGGYVPYTGAAANVDLGVYNLTASAVNVNGSGSNAGVINLESNAIFPLVNGYGTIGSGTTNQFNFYQTTGAGVFRGAILSLNSIPDSVTRTYTLPNADGTLALSSDLGNYVTLSTTQTIVGQKTFTSPLTIGTTGNSIIYEQSGNLIFQTGASADLTIPSSGAATFGFGLNVTGALDVTGSVTAQQSNITADGAGVVLQGYVDNNLRIAVRGSGYNSGARGGLLASTGDFSGQVTVSSNSGIIVGSNSRAFIRQTVGGDAEIGAPANGTLALFSNGSSVLSFIGTGAATFSSSVTAKSLKIENTGVPGFIYFNNTSAPASNYIALGSGANELYFHVNGSDRIVIKDNGNVGIGTASPNKLLEVAKAEANNNIILTESSDSGDDTALFYARRSRGTSLSSPTAIQSLNNIGGLAIGAYNGSAYAIGAKIKANSNQNWTTSAQGTNLIFETTADNTTTLTERMRITSGGNVGIGTNNPNLSATNRTVLDINGVSTSLLVFSSGGSFKSYIFNDGSNLDIQAPTFSIGTSNTTRLSINSGGSVNISSLGTGTVTATAGTLSTVSDSSFKVDDGFIDSAIEKVLSLKPRYFYWNEKSGLPTDIRQLGFYAQEVNEALGEEAANTPLDENTPWGITDRSIIAMLTKAIQELKIEIDSLKNQIK